MHTEALVDLLSHRNYLR